MADADEKNLIFESDDETNQANGTKKAEGTAGENKGLGMHSTSFKDFLLKPEILKGIGEAGFEQPSHVQKEAIPIGILGEDLICQAKSGMGKTAVFVIAVLHQLDMKKADPLQCLVMAHTRELAFQIHKEFERLGRYIYGLRCELFLGGFPLQVQRDLLKNKPPHIAVGTPGRILDLVKSGHLNLDKLRFFILDECDRMLDNYDMRRDIQDIFYKTKPQKQTMMFSATFTPESKEICRKFMRKPQEIFVDNEKKLTLHGLQQFYCEVPENDKIKTLDSLLKKLQYNQTVIFLKSVERAKYLDEVLLKAGHKSITIHRDMPQPQRLEKLKDFKSYSTRILVSTDLASRGLDIEKVNVVFNYDMPDSSDTYLHRVGRAGRFGTKGLAISFVTTDEDKKILEDIQGRFEIQVPKLPETIDERLYNNN